MQFPEDSVLLARGKYSTLGRERNAQIRRVQDTCRTIQAQVVHVLRDCEEKPPVDPSPLQLIEKCVASLQDARSRLVTLGNDLNALEPEAWQ